MRRATRKAGLVVLGLAVAALLFGSGCGGGPGPFSDAIDLSHAGTILGKVTDAKTGEPLAGAVVTTQGRATISDGGGAYRLGDDLRTGWHTVAVSRDGYLAVDRSADIVVYTVLDFKLVPDA